MSARYTLSACYVVAYSLYNEVIIEFLNFGNENNWGFAYAEMKYTI